MLTDRAKRVHFVGAGGIGMSGIARILLQMGYPVSGSDVTPNNLTRCLETAGARMYRGHAAAHIPRDAGLVVYSTSIGADNPELCEATRRGIPLAHRAEVLAELFNGRKGIAVTGTHGKTTTTSMIAVVLKHAGLDPALAIGGEVACLSGNASCGSGAWFVAEADESDGSFLNLAPLHAVVTNMEAEHLDHFGSLARIEEAFRAFCGRVREGGTIFYCADEPNLRKLLAGRKGPSVGYGLSGDASISARNITMDGFTSSYECLRGGEVLGMVRLEVPGRHNVQNSLAAVAVGLALGIDFRTIAEALRAFSGTRRRFDLRCESGGVMLIEDYAHHPTEICAVLEACRNWKGKRLIAVFQPHRYTRTQRLAEAFGTCFRGVDKLILTDIYAASEEPIKGVSIHTIYDAVTAAGMQDVSVVKRGELVRHIRRMVRPGDMVLMLGAGDIGKIADLLAERLQADPPVDAAALARFRRSFTGRVRRNEPLAGHTTLKVGGPASLWVEPRDMADLRRAVRFAAGRKLPWFVIGKGSNVLAADNGFCGMAIHLCAPFFAGCRMRGTTVRVGAGHSLPKLVKACCAADLGGLESLAGIPGSVGGAVAMNAGGYNNPLYRNIGELVTSVRVMDRAGKVRTLRGGDLSFGYRSSDLAPYVITEVTLKLHRAPRGSLQSCFRKFMSLKREKQVLDLPSAGCVFKNPPDSQFTCGQMIETLGLKGKRIGGAVISEKHANFIVNGGGATARDVCEMISLVRERVAQNYRVPLELEVTIL